jgi:type I restriction-modification system DNA methylase subunit
MHAAFRADARAIEAAHKRFAKALATVSYSSGQREAFRDFLTCAACSLRQATNRAIGRFDQEIEDQYEAIRRRYRPEQFEAFPVMFAAVVDGLMEPNDFLGRAYMNLEMKNRDAGQFFTPFEVAAAVSAMQLPSDPRAFIESCGGVIRLNEPSCGSGVFVLAFAHLLKANGIDPRCHMHATMVDIDMTCCLMAYIQTTLLGIPATIVHGNSLSLETFWAADNLHAVMLAACGRLKPREPSERQEGAGKRQPDESGEKGRTDGDGAASPARAAE